MRDKLFKLKQTLKRLGIEKYSDKINNLIKVATPLDDIYIGNKSIKDVKIVQDNLSDAEKKILSNSTQLFDLFKEIKVPFELHVVPPELQLDDILRDPPSLILGAINQNNSEEEIYADLSSKRILKKDTVISNQTIKEISQWVGTKKNPSKAIIIWGLGGLSQNLLDPVSTEATWTLHDMLHVLEGESDIRGMADDIKRSIQNIEDVLRDSPDLDPEARRIADEYERFVAEYTPDVEFFDTYATTFAAMTSKDARIEAILKKIEGNDQIKKELRALSLETLKSIDRILDFTVGKFIFLP